MIPTTRISIRFPIFGTNETSVQCQHKKNTGMLGDGERAKPARYFDISKLFDTRSKHDNPKYAQPPPLTLLTLAPSRGLPCLAKTDDPWKTSPVRGPGALPLPPALLPPLRQSARTAAAACRRPFSPPAFSFHGERTKTGNVSCCCDYNY